MGTLYIPQLYDGHGNLPARRRRNQLLQLWLQDGLQLSSPCLVYVQSLRILRTCTFPLMKLTSGGSLQRSNKCASSVLSVHMVTRFPVWLRHSCPFIAQKLCDRRLSTIFYLLVFSGNAECGKMFELLEN